MKNEMRLIDANKAIEKINCLCVDGNENWIGTENQSFVDHADVVDILADAPTVEAVPVVRGRWQSYLDGEHIMPDVYFKCSKCGSRGHRIRWHYCPNCGARMDGGKNDER